MRRNINRYHIGSFTFAALLLTLVRIMQLVINSSGKESDNACARCIQCFISCVLSQVEYMLRVLNSTAVAVMAGYGGIEILRDAKESRGEDASARE